MKVDIAANPAQARQIKQRLATPEESLSYELGKAVQELPPFYTRLLAGGVSALVFGAVAWAYFSEIDEVAMTQGKLVPSTEVRPIRSTNVGSVIRTNVKAGASVKKDDVLVEFGTNINETDVKRLEQERSKIREDVARLEAENSGGKSGNALQDSLIGARKQDESNRQAAAVQDARSKQEAISQEVSRRDTLQANRLNAEVTIQNAKERLSNAQAKEERLRTLNAQLAVPHIEYMNAKDQVTAAQNELNEALDRVDSIDGQIQVQNDRIRQAQEAYQSAISTAQTIAPQRQTEVLTQLIAKKEELTKKEGEIALANQQKTDRETVKAPFDGTIFNVKVTEGPVQQGEELLSVAPANQDLILEVKVSNRDIGFIRRGLRAKVKMATFPYQEFGIIDGEVIDISPDAVVEKNEQGQDMGPVFPAKIRLSKRSVVVRGKEVELTPGMVASADVVTRKRSILTYLMEPVTRRFSESLGER
jgi:HlyD family secretion protein